MTFRTLVASTLFAAVAMGSTACAAPLPKQTEATKATVTATAKRLERADVIELKKDFMAIGDHWSVKVNNREIATIEGLDLKAIGDTYSILTPSGGFVAGEDEEIFSTSRKARFYDSDQKTTGVLKKDLLSFGARYTLKDTAGKRTARLEQKFSLTFKGDIKNSAGKRAWTMKRKAMSASPKIVLTRVGDGRTVSALDAIRISVVASEVYDAENE